MSPVEIFLIAVGLAIDAFAVSLGTSASGLIKERRAKFRLAFHFGLFQFFMPIIGWYSGHQFVSRVGAFDHWIAFALLAFVGAHMMLPDGETRVMKSSDPSRGWTLLVLSVATSIDALAVGFSLAVLHMDIWYPCIVIGITTAVLSLVGIRLGNRLGMIFGRRMEVVGGIILIFIGLRILYSHILA